MNEGGFFNLGRTPPQQGRPAAGGRNVPPPPPPAPARQIVNPQGGGGGGGVPPPPPPAPGQQPMMQQAHQGHHGHQMPPAPQPHQIPQQMRQRPLVEISDIRRERRTEADYRDELTTYIVYRFEKVMTEDGYDSDGDKVKATWENCVRTQVADISKKNAFRDIQSLNKNSKSLADKKKGLLPAQQRQLEKALEELKTGDRDDRFEYSLIQIDHQLKPVNKSDKDKDKDKKAKKEIFGKKKLVIKDNKKKYQRVSITAYYKRAPLTTINAQQLARDMMAQQQHAMQQQRERAMFMQHQQQQQQMAQEHARMQQQQQHHHQQQQQHQNPRIVPVHHPNERHGNGGGQGQGRHHDRRDRHYHGSTSSDHSSIWSDDESGSEGSTAFTEPSSRSSYERHRRPKKYIEETPKHFGVHHGATRRHSIHDDANRAPLYVMSGSPRAPDPPQPQRLIAQALPQESLERLKQYAYEEGRADQRDDDIRAEMDALRYQPRTAPRPAILQSRPTLVRHVTSSEVDRQLDDYDGRFATMTLNDPRRSVEVLYPHEVEEIRREELRRRRAAEARFRMDEEDSLLLERERQAQAEEYIRRREYSPPNPFAPRRRSYYD